MLKKSVYRTLGLSLISLLALSACQTDSSSDLSTSSAEKTEAAEKIPVKSVKANKSENSSKHEETKHLSNKSKSSQTSPKEANSNITKQGGSTSHSKTFNLTKLFKNSPSSNEPTQKSTKEMKSSDKNNVATSKGKQTSPNNNPNNSNPQSLPFAQTNDKNQASKNKKLSKLYQDVLDHLDHYEFNKDAKPEDVHYSYALAWMTPSDTPQLLVSQQSKFGMSYLKVFSANDDCSQVLVNDDIIQVGVAPAGGFRGDVSQSEKDHALIYTSFSSGSGQTSVEKLTLVPQKNKLEVKKETLWEGIISDLSPDDYKSTALNFVDISDKSSLEELLSSTNRSSKKAASSPDKTKSNSSNEGAKATDNSKEQLVEAERNAGKSVVSGTVKVFNHKEMVAYQNENPNNFPDMGQKYVVLILDQATDLKMHSGGGPGYSTHNVSLIKLPDTMANYDGQHLTISFSSDDGYWQSDASLPMDAPRMNQVKLLQ
ncbi:hypothetical protein D3H64_02035 [Atopobacter sp. AH10]|uniref:hypothetical protein n=1 Tax=Atopobacter sp. AH10 TaxID=2315861 RepID=UPI000EF19C52|nr:hypothetical protein [Atopobacter sp. AH10]RLK63946.1 hypothetical protein D3H64_02035 [Atopobacter sp. AH10]